MKYISIDLETTGLDPKECQIIEFGAVLEDTSTLAKIEHLDYCHYYLRYDRLSGSPFALNMNAEIIRRIASLDSQYPLIRPSELGVRFHNWLLNLSLPVLDNGKISINAAGKNFAGFDRRFLEQPEYNFFNVVSILHRTIDPAVFFLKIEDKSVPDMKTCLERAGISKDLSHTAVEDARDVIRLMRVATNNYQKAGSYAEIPID